MKYTAVYEREDDGRWVVRIPRVKGCHSYGRTIDQARERIREALSLYVKNAKSATIVDDIRLPASVQKQVVDAQTFRDDAAKAESAMVNAQLKAVRLLRKFKLGHRDAGRLLGLSHQRVHQLEKRNE
jgi:predicted RNase H-like HicB family nuclease